MPDGCHQGNRGHSLGYPQTKYPAEEKIRIVVDGFRCEETIAELYRREGIAQSIYHKWSLAFMEAGKRRLAGETARATSTDEVTTPRQKNMRADNNCHRADLEEPHPAGQSLLPHRPRSADRSVRRSLQSSAIPREHQQPHPCRRLLWARAIYFKTTRKD